MKQETSQMMAIEVADWRHRGLITQAQETLLAARYDNKGVFFSTLLKWLGLFAIIMLSVSILSFIDVMFHSEIVGALILGMLALGFWWFGTRMAIDPRQKNPFSGAVLVTVGLMAVFGSLHLLCSAVSIDVVGITLATLMFITGGLSLASAYAFRLRWPLLLALLFFFHGIGSWHRYDGQGAYLFDIQDPKKMACIALLSIILGLWHEHRAEQNRTIAYVGFGRLYTMFGLLYLNLSLLIMSLSIGIEDNQHDALQWALALGAASIAEIFAGARFKDGKCTGFGIVFLGINLYTRFFENFWDRLSAGSFFLIAGILAIVLGYVFEKLGKQAAPTAESLA